MKTINIRLPDVEAAMLAEVRRKASKLRALERLILYIIRSEYSCLLKDECASGFA